MYLNKNIIGAASQELKGNKGDKVTVVPFDGFNEMVLVENKGNRFWVWPEDLSETYDKNKETNIPAEVVSQSAKSVQRSNKVKRRR